MRSFAFCFILSVPSSMGILCIQHISIQTSHIPNAQQQYVASGFCTGHLSRAHRVLLINCPFIKWEQGLKYFNFRCLLFMVSHFPLTLRQPIFLHRCYKCSHLWQIPVPPITHLFLQSEKKWGELIIKQLSTNKALLLRQGSE